MTAILHNEARQLRRSSLILAGAFAVIAAFFLAVFPAMQEEAELIADAYPEYMIVLLGVEELHTIEGFSAGYIYPMLWILFGGIYFAYVGGGMIAGDIRSRKMDLTLSNPVSRESVIAQKVGALWFPLVVLNAALMLIVYGGAAILGESFDLEALLMVHLLSVPYLLVCAGIGLVLSVLLDRAGQAQVMGLGLVFILWLIDGISLLDADYEWVGDLTPSRYYNVNDILVHAEYDFGDASILLVAFLTLVLMATFLFVRRDI